MSTNTGNKLQVFSIFLNNIFCHDLISFLVHEDKNLPHHTFLKVRYTYHVFYFYLNHILRPPNYPKMKIACPLGIVPDLSLEIPRCHVSSRGICPYGGP